MNRSREPLFDLRPATLVLVALATALILALNGSLAPWLRPLAGWLGRLFQ